MQQIILFDDETVRGNMLPLAFTRPVGKFRIGISTLAEKWSLEFATDEVSFLTVDYLQAKYPTISDDDSLFIASHILPSDELTEKISALALGEALTYEGNVIAFRGSLDDFKAHRFSREIVLTEKPDGIYMLFDIFMKNGDVLVRDFRRLTQGRTSQPLSDTNTIIGEAHYADGLPKIFIEEGATVEGAYLNVKNGPIYIGKDAEIMEGVAIRAPFAACEHAVVNMVSKIYGATTLGPYCKVGGELNNVVMQAYSNKAHDGFLGNAVIGEWCNIGAGVSASNLKNDYSEIKLWNYPAHRFLRTGLQFCGLIMGDHSKCGINSMLNTATVLGVGVNIYGAGFPRNFVASFMEGSATTGYTNVRLTKFFDIATRMMARRGKSLDDMDREMYRQIYELSQVYR